LDKKEKPKKSFLQSFSSFKFLLTELDIKSIISLGIMLVRKLYARVKPKHLFVFGVVGFSDPCYTGQFLGLYEAVTCSAGLRRDIDLRGDFGRKNFELDLKVAGHFAIAALMVPSIWFIMQKPVRDGIKIIKNTERAIS
jgi:hypothetical protein